MSYSRGSEWRQWDLHIHSPASYHWNGAKFQEGGKGAKDIPVVDAMIEAMNNAKPAVFALMDYWHFEGWFALKSRLPQQGAPELRKTVFPGIELRLAAPIKGRLNAHVIFSNEVTDQQLINFRAALRLHLINQPLSDDGLRQYARQLGDDVLKKHGFKKDEVMGDNVEALRAGCHLAELTCESYQDAIDAMPDGTAIGFMPFDTNDGLADVDFVKHTAYALTLFKSSPIFEARNIAHCDAFVGRETDANKGYFKAFFEALNRVPRLPVSGSDAHAFIGTPGDNNHRGYGDYPSGKITWIKADPTWLGLQQALREPEKRCYIGLVPPKLNKVAENKTFYIDKVTLWKEEGSPLPDQWFSNCEILLNHDLVAIIGNKGSGKSALADTIALLGNSQQNKFFSFLKADRFRGKAGEPAKHFSGRLDWLAGEPSEANLASDPSPDKVEMVRYIPQGRFEVLCNEHVAGRSDAFEKELRSVIFSHLGEERQGALDFDQLIASQELSFRLRLDELRKNLKELNRTIVSIEDQLHPDIKANLGEQIRLKTLQLEELNGVKPQAMPEPTEELAPAQKAAADKLAEIAEKDKAIVQKAKELTEAQAINTAKRVAGKKVSERLTLLGAQFKQALIDIDADLQTLELNADQVLALKIDFAPIQATLAELTETATKNAAEIKKCADDRLALVPQSKAASDALNEPQRLYQASVVALAEWQAKKDAVVGAADVPDSLEGLKKRLTQIEELPAELEKRRHDRLALSNRIFEILAEQRDARADLFKPLQEIIEKDQLIRVEYKLQFQANLTLFHEAIAETVFSMARQQVGEIRGDAESYAAIKICCDPHNPNSADGAVGVAKDIADLLERAARQSSGDAKGIRSIMRKDRQPFEIYDYVYGLEYIEPKYTLLFQDTPIQQLSPGQRGALLLIFYLLVDKGRNPLILDQPEENLDNETIVNLLVPVITKAKKNRQIIMVTHNPNLAVVCDAEQIINAQFDRPNKSTVIYRSGAIEANSINVKVVDILEGTKPAFDNRSKKYH